MNILLVSQYFWPEAFPVNDLVAAWQERGHQVTVLTGIPNYPSGTTFPGYSSWRPVLEHYGCSRVVRVPLIPRGRTRLQLSANYLSYVLSASLSGPLRCRERYDCIFVNQLSPATVGFPAVIMKALRRAPIALWIQDLWPHSLAAVGAVRSQRLLRVVERSIGWLYRRCDLILVQSQAFLPEVERAGADASRVRYLPNWAGPAYRPLELEAEAPERAALPGGFVAMFAGNLGEVQALETILGAAKLMAGHDDFHWVLIGDGSRREWLVAEIARHNLSGTVHWLPRRPPEEMPRWLAAADALVVTLAAGPAMALTLPTKVQSYLACGRPILAALDGEGARVVEHSGAGLTSPAQDAAALAANARRLLQEPPAARRQRGRSGRAYAQTHFDREQLIDRLDGWLEELIERRS